jgi:D-inositol-3-phosphate glycosyltransferase
MVTVHTSPLSLLGGKDAGGLNVYVRDLAAQLAERGIDVDIFTRRYDLATPPIVSVRPGVNVISVDAGPSEILPKDDLYCFLPDFASEVALYSLRNGTRYDVVHSHYWLSGRAAQLLQRYWPAPTIHTYHTLAHLKNAVTVVDQHESALRLTVERQLLDALDHFVAPNPDELAELVWGLGAHSSKICTIPPGIDLDRFYPVDASSARRKLNLPDVPFVLYVGRIDPIKDLPMLLRAFARVKGALRTQPEPKLLIIGGSAYETADGTEIGDDLRPVLRHAAQLGIGGDVIFRGAQPQDLLPLYYAAATVCAVPSLYESFGLVAVEAMACGLPVVATRVGGMKFTVEEDYSGLLVPRGDDAAMARALQRILEDRDLRATLQVGARQAAIRFSWHTVGSAVLNLYERLADGQRADLCCFDEIYAS